MWAKTGHLCRRATGRGLGREGQFGGAGCQGISKTGWTMLFRLMKSTDLATAWIYLGRRGSPQKKTGSCQHFHPWNESLQPTSPPALGLKLVNWIPLRISLILFELLSLHWSKNWVSLWVSESMRGPLRKFASVSGILLGCNPHSFSQPEVIGTSFPGTETLGWRTCCGAGTLLFLGKLCRWDILLDS